jgi:uncharacterized DUF497 family protein
VIDLTRVEGFDWDEGNAQKSVNKHDVLPVEAEQVFFNVPLLMLEDLGHSVGEARYYALGRTDSGRLLSISLTLRDEGKLIRVISARPMSRKERAVYEKA